MQFPWLETNITFHAVEHLQEVHVPEEYKVIFGNVIFSFWAKLISLFCGPMYKWNENDDDDDDQTLEDTVSSSSLPSAPLPLPSPPLPPPPPYDVKAVNGAEVFQNDTLRVSAVESCRQCLPESNDVIVKATTCTCLHVKSALATDRSVLFVAK